MRKRLISVLLSLAIMCTLLPQWAAFEADAVTSYNPQVALQFAAEHWNDGKGLCAEFVSRCLNAGGCDSFNKSCTALVGLLRQRTDCTEYTIYMNPDRSVSMSNYLDKIAPGDPLFYHCSFQNNYQHAILCNGMDANGLLKAYAHNLANDGSRAVYYNLRCPECHHGSIDYLTAFHFDTSPPVLSSCISDSRQQDAVPKTFFTGKQYYLRYKLYDEATGKLFDTFSSVKYTVSAEVLCPDGSVLCTSSFCNDCNWLSVRCAEAGTYSYCVTAKGEKFTATDSGTFEIYDSAMSLTADTEHMILMLSDRMPKTLRLDAEGFRKNPLSVRIETDEERVFSAELVSFEDRTVQLLLTPKQLGNGSVTVSLFDAVTSEKLVDKTVQVTVGGVEAGITYSACGGTDAPAAQKGICGEEVFLSKQCPTESSYTLRFDANGGTAEETERQCAQRFSEWNTAPDGTGTPYLPGELYTMSASVTLYAQYDRCIAGVLPNAEKDGAYLLGWFDSPESDSYGAPAGNRYTENTELSSDITLYAMWSASAQRLYGDLNSDGEITEADQDKMRDILHGEAEASAEDQLCGDLDADGVIDTDDGMLLRALLEQTVSQQELPAYQMPKQTEVSGSPKTEYRYAEPFDTDGLELCISAGESAYVISEGLTVSGYDPYTVGAQTVTVCYDDFSDDLSVTVLPPQYLLNLDADGGELSCAQCRVSYGEPFGLLPTPTKAGYTFLGWTLDGETELTPETIWEAFSDQTASACWKAGCAPDGHAYETVIIAPTCTEKGYTEYFCTACEDGYCGCFTDTLEHSYTEGYCIYCGKPDASYLHGTCDGGVNCPGTSFTDYPKCGNWAHKGIDFCLERGLFAGDSAKKFLPNDAMTRAMLVTVLYRLEGSPASERENPFADIVQGAWYTDAVLWAAEQKIVNGMKQNLFCPDEAVSREQIATIFYRFADYKGYDTGASSELSGFPDENAVSDWAYAALSWAVCTGLIAGNGKGGESWLDPQMSATRAQVATIFMRFLQEQ